MVGGFGSKFAGSFLLLTSRGQTCEPRRGWRWEKPNQLKKDRKGSRCRATEDHGGDGRTGRELGAARAWPRALQMVATNASRTSPLPSVTMAFVAQDHRKKPNWTDLQISGNLTAVIRVDDVTSQATPEENSFLNVCPDRDLFSFSLTFIAPMLYSCSSPWAAPNKAQPREAEVLTAVGGS